MYEDTENIQYWIATLNSGEKPDIDSEIPSSPGVTLSKPFGIQDPRDLQNALHDKYKSFGSPGSLSTIDDLCHWLAHHMSSVPDSSDGTSAATSDGDAMTTCIDVTSHNLPPTSDSLFPLRNRCSCACSQDVHRAMAQQGVLLNVFHEELRQIIPNDWDYNSTWLEEVDPASNPVQLHSYAGDQRGLLHSHDCSR